VYDDANEFVFCSVIIGMHALHYFALQLLAFSAAAALNNRQRSGVRDISVRQS